MEDDRDMNAEATEAEARVRILRAEENGAERKTHGLIKAEKEPESKVAGETGTKIAKSSSNEQNQNTATTDREIADSHGDVKTGEHPTSNIRTYGRLVLNPPKRTPPFRLRLSPPKRKRSRSRDNIRPTRLRLSPPKRHRSVSVEGRRPTRLRLNPPKRKGGEESAVAGEGYRYGRVSEEGAGRVRRERGKVCYGRV